MRQTAILFPPEHLVVQRVQRRKALCEWYTRVTIMVLRGIRILYLPLTGQYMGRSGSKILLEFISETSMSFSVPFVENQSAVIRFSCCWWTENHNVWTVTYTLASLLRVRRIVMLTRDNGFLVPFCRINGRKKGLPPPRFRRASSHVFVHTVKPSTAYQPGNGWKVSLCNE
jgi:hypothetical protein